VLIALLTAEEMSAWDSRAVSELGVPERALMESAGRAVADLVDTLYPRGTVVGVTGSGKNGGDTLIALRTLLARGREVAVVAVGDRRPEESLAHGWPLRFAEAREAEALLSGAGVLLDGILGTGARGAPRPPQAALISRMNAAGAPTLAVDGPSGVDLTTGAVTGDAVQAEVTVTFGALKRGLALHPGRRHAGRVLVVEIGFPPLEPAEQSAAVVTAAWAGACLPRVPWNAHKGDLGNVVVVAGQPGVAGAAALVGHGAARAGAGKVFLVSSAENRETLQTVLPEALFRHREGTELEDTLTLADAVVAGPGIGVDASASRLLARILEVVDVPLLLDADALTLMSIDSGLRPRDWERVLLTPHPGELSRMTGRSVGEIVADPFAALEEGLDRYGGAILLKGAPSLVGELGRQTLANLTGHSGIATGGMGDTLAGIAGAFMAAGSSAREAGALALYFSGRAAEIAGRGRGLLPRDIAEHLPGALLDRVPGSRSLPGVLLEIAAPY
jgi:ADP-dependent NAD(P)H-hydrate dehydratase / NAD(P)H-hydrate epimerase